MITDTRLAMPARRTLLAGFAAAAIAFAGTGFPSSAAAQSDYPTRPVTLIVPFSPGGPTDIIARALGDSLGRSLGQPIVVENRPGAGGNIGITAAARAEPDGYTLLLTSTAIAVNQALYKELPYNPDEDFAPISLLVIAPNVLVVKADSGIETIADLVEKAKASPGTFDYASPGVGTKSHLTGELLKMAAEIDMVHVPFQGAGPAVQAVVAGTTEVAAVALAPAEPLIKSGELNALAVTGSERWFSLPDTPTMIEAGYPKFVSETFSALLAPSGTPQPILDKLVEATQAAMKTDEMREIVRNSGFEIVAGGPEELTQRIKDEVPVVKELVSRAGIELR